MADARRRWAPEQRYQGVGYGYSERKPAVAGGVHLGVVQGFKHDGAVAWALVPALALAASAGGTVCLWTLTVGAMLSYTLDALRMREACLSAIWGTLLLVDIGLLFSSQVFDHSRSFVLNGALFMTFGQLLFLVGLWATLQFRWVAQQHPSAVLAAERLLFACVPVTSTAVQTWGLAVVVGPTAAPFVLMAVLAFYYRLFATPATSSFMRATTATVGGGGTDAQLRILGATESAIHTATLLGLPVAFYVTLHWPTLLSDTLHVYSVCLLGALPTLFVCFCAARCDALWWLRLPPKALDRLLFLVAAAALLVAVAGLEGRVVFVVFKRYLVLPSPWNWLLMAVQLYGLGVFVASHSLGAIGPQLPPPVALTALITSAVAGSLALGAPLWLLPAPFLSAMGLGNFYFSGREARDYGFFMTGAVLSFAWFLSHHFWFLDMRLNSMSLSELCRYAVAGFALAAAAPGLLQSKAAPKGLTATLLVMQAVLLATLEERLYGVPHADDIGVYPAYLIVATSAVGEFMVQALTTRALLHPLGAWVLRCVFAAKLVVLVVPGVHVMPAAALVALTCTAHVVIPTRTEAGPGARRLPATAGWAMTAGVLVALLAARNVVFDLAQALTGHRPPAASLLGAMLCVTAAAAHSMAQRHFEGLPGAQRGVLALAAVGLLLLLLQPPLPHAVQLLWDPEHAPEETMDDTEIYGARPTARSAWPAWLLLLTCLGGVASAASPAAATRPAAAQVLYAATSGAGVGVYVAAEYFRNEAVLQMVVGGVAVATALVLTFLQRPSPSSPAWVPLVFAATVAALPVGMLLHHTESQPPSGRMSPEEAAAYEEVRTTLLAFFACVFALVAFSIKLKVTALLREDGGGGGGARKGGRTHATHRVARPSHLRPLASALWSRQMAAFGGAWMPAVGNVAVALAVVLALALNLALTGGADAAVFAICPLLLLLNQDVYLLTSYGDRQRYFPLAAAIAVYLTASSVWFLLDSLALASTLTPSGEYIHALGVQQYLTVLKNLIALLFTLPLHYLFNRFLYDGTRAADMTLLCLAPLNLPPLLLADTSSVQWLAGIALVQGVAQYVMSRRVHLTGLRYI